MQVSASTTGTSYKGCIEATFDELVATFGNPGREGDPDKIRAQWVVDTPSGIATIYDWKQYDIAIEDVIHWHIGGHDAEVVAWVNFYCATVN